MNTLMSKKEFDKYCDTLLIDSESKKSLRRNYLKFLNSKFSPQTLVPCLEVDRYGEKRHVLLREPVESCFYTLSYVRDKMYTGEFGNYQEKKVEFYEAQKRCFFSGFEYRKDPEHWFVFENKELNIMLIDKDLVTNNDLVKYNLPITNAFRRHIGLRQIKLSPLKTKKIAL